MFLIPNLVRLWGYLLHNLRKYLRGWDSGDISGFEEPLKGALGKGTLWEQNEPESGTDNQREKTRVLLEECFIYTNLVPIWVEDGEGMVRISFDDECGSSSLVGRYCQRAPPKSATTNLENISSATRQPSLEEAFIILHECGHIFGFIHEHQAPARPKHFNFIESEVQREFGKDGHRWSREETRKNVTRPHQQKHIENCSQFDRNSIMMYRFPASLTYEGVGTPLNTKLSDIDKAVLTLNYARLEPHLKAPNWTVAYAVDILGIEGELKEKIVSSKDCRDIRAYYTEWSTQQMESLDGKCIVS
ncbi:hypothetical protein NLI96_g4369 [Meripilus lineatus]|uniref:Metalloendopeptidase n=1 Tax=Meripilus lineatus TaxID=2056292 RepID=A0AAD5V792_9APHY|nr:hypothetical protein NLI96_g4369 [Physisporinus lineatus]